jgi:uncharacterized membrane protein YphA (DoxX/SURF4 family)
MFPDGVPGLGLLLLRIAAGAALLSLGSARWFLGKPDVSNIPFAILSSATGFFFVVGYRTALIAFFGTCISLAAAASILRVPILSAGASDVAGIFNAIIAIALLCLGPGAYSIDAYRHGLREIVIPRRRSSSTNLR